jgi:hypothetical protein
MGWGEPAANGNVVSLDYAACGQNVVCSGASDHGNVYYIRSTDFGLTWGTPVKLNTDSGTAMQWQPSLTTTQSGMIFASWYDEREVNGGADLNCTVGSSTQNCYRRWGRVSLDNGATWQPDDMVGRALSPLPAQPDGAVQATYEGDYDYHSANGTTAIGGWTDGRMIISNTSQQDVFVNFVQGAAPTATPTATATATATPIATVTPTPTPTPTSGITLTASGRKVHGIDTVDLVWHEAPSTNVDIYRNGVIIATVPNTPSSYTDSTGQRGHATFTYKVCEAGTQNCSNQVTVTF